MSLSRRLFIRSAVVFTCCFSLMSLASADEQTRKVFLFDNGKIINTKGMFWREFVGDDKYYFVEVGRNKEYIELYDDSRELTFRVYSTKATLQRNKDAAFEDWHTGKWDK